jgi:hypothetical protein
LIRKTFSLSFLSFPLFLFLFLPNKMGSSLCQYSESLGRPGEGFHKQRFAGLALYDVAGTLLLAYASFKHEWVLPPQTSYLYHALFWFVVATFLHVLFCVKTPISSFFINEKAS